MKISLPVLLSAGTSFRAPTHNWFASDNVGEYAVDFAVLNQRLRRFFIQAQTAGWEIVSITPIAGGVFNWRNSTSTNASWGYGWGTGATEGVVILISRDVRHEDLRYLPIVHEAVRDIEARLRMALEKRAELTKEMERLEPAPVREIRKGLMGRLSGYGFLEHEFATEREAEQKKQSMLETMKRSLAEFDERISEIRIRDHITGVPPEVLDRLVPTVPIGDIAQSFDRLIAGPGG